MSAWDDLRSQAAPTPDEDAAVKRALGVVWDWNENGDVLAAAVLRAIREEREACAELADSKGAARIRARGSS